MLKVTEEPTIELVVKYDETNFLINRALTFHVPKDVTSISVVVATDQPMWFTYMLYDEQKKLRAQFLKGNAPQPVVIHTDSGKLPRIPSLVLSIRGSGH